VDDVASRRIAKNPTNRISSFSARLSVTESQLDGFLTKLWEVEEVIVKPGKESSMVCESNYQETTTRDKKGGYDVFFTFKEPNKINLGNSRSSFLLSLVLRSAKSFTSRKILFFVV